jgi:hypothetical protein
VDVFPAFSYGIALGGAAERILLDGEAGCFYHPDKKATIPCSACGRFLCALCDVDLNGQHVCPACLQSGQKKGKLAELESSRTVYDSAALSLALWPLLVWPVTIVTAPIAVVLAIMSWFRPNSIVKRTRVGSYVAILIGAAQIAGWVFLLVEIMREISES